MGMILAILRVSGKVDVRIEWLINTERGEAMQSATNLITHAGIPSIPQEEETSRLVIMLNISMAVVGKKTMVCGRGGGRKEVKDVVEGGQADAKRDPIDVK